MKLNKKKVFTLALAVCLIAILSLSTLAWFTDDDSVTNDFMIDGSESGNPDDVFSIDVWEKDDEGNRYDDEGIEYPAILPGDDLYKEVNVENTGAYDQYARVIVTVSDAHIWQELNGEVYVPLNKIATDLSSKFQPWSIEYDAEADTLTYVLYYNQILKVDEVVNLFTNVAIPEDLDRYQAAEMLGGFQIGVVAEAVQTENVGANAAEAFATVGKAIEAGNRTINLSSTNVEDVLDIMANNPNAEVELDLTDVIVDKPVVNQGTLEITGGTIEEPVVNQGTLEMTGGTIEAPDRGFSNSGEATLNNVDMTTGSAAAYGNVTDGADAKTTYNDVEITANGGGMGVVGGSEVEFNSGSVNMVATTTNPRYVFYLEGEGSVVTINGGEFDFTAKTLKRAYVYAGAGTTVYINGGTFGTASTRSGYTAGILGDGTVIITGGTFGFNPSNWVAEGYVAVQNGNTWTVVAQ